MRVTWQSCRSGANSLRSTQPSRFGTSKTPHSVHLTFRMHYPPPERRPWTTNTSTTGITGAGLLVGRVHWQEASIHEGLIAGACSRCHCSTARSKWKPGVSQLIDSCRLLEANKCSTNHYVTIYVLLDLNNELMLSHQADNPCGRFHALANASLR